MAKSEWAKRVSDAYSEADTPKVGDNILAQITVAADELQAADEEVELLEAKLKAAVERRRQIAEDTLPQLMDAAEQVMVKTSSGLTVVLDDKVFANISEERKDGAFKWLTENGHEALIKNKFEVQFPKDSVEIAAAFEDYLNKNLRRKANLKHSVSVHPSTLTSWVKEELDKGTNLPFDLLGIVRRKVCKVK